MPAMSLSAPQIPAVFSTLWIPPKRWWKGEGTLPVARRLGDGGKFGVGLGLGVICDHVRFICVNMSSSESAILRFSCLSHTST